jgi:hypothetical protein
MAVVAQDRACESCDQPSVGIGEVAPVIQRIEPDRGSRQQ